MSNRFSGEIFDGT
jgi:hypothetical protein